MQAVGAMKNFLILDLILQKVVFQMLTCTLFSIMYSLNHKRKCMYI
jgi:hypothetical protein